MRTSRDADAQEQPSASPRSSRPNGGASHADAWDFIVGSDLIYLDEGVRQLPRVLAALATSHTTIYYAHTKRRFESLDDDFMQELKLCALNCVEVMEPWAAALPESPPPFSSLFPDMRIAVYRIQKAQIACP